MHDTVTGIEGKEAGPCVTLDKCSGPVQGTATSTRASTFVPMHAESSVNLTQVSGADFGIYVRQMAKSNLKHCTVDSTLKGGVVVSSGTTRWAGETTISNRGGVRM